MPIFSETSLPFPARIGIRGSMLLALLTSLLLILSFPPPDLGFLAWFALVPLAIACHDRSLAVSFLLGMFSGAVACAGIFSWTFHVPGFRTYHFLPGILYLALYPAAWTSSLALLRQRSRSPLLFAPAIWVAFDFLKSHAGFLSLPWANLAHSQHHNLAGIQVASLTGEYGVTFLVVMGNMALYTILTRGSVRKAISLMALILLVHLWGIHELSAPEQGPTLKVAIVQPAIQPAERTSSSGRNGSLVRLEDLTRHAAAKQPALIAWPETAVRALNLDMALSERLNGLAETLGVPLVVGSSDYSKMLVRKASPLDKRYAFNSAYCIVPGRYPDPPYRKRLLVPFGEYLPHISPFRWPEWFVPEFVETRPGTGNVPFTLADGTRFSTMICWENLFPEYVRTLAANGSCLIVQLTNDAWFGNTGAPFQHNQASVLRAVENNVPVVVASNTGPSQLIDGHGRIAAAFPELFQTGLAVGELRLKRSDTPYSRYGDLFAFITTGIALVGVFPRSR